MAEPFRPPQTSLIEPARPARAGFKVFIGLVLPWILTILVEWVLVGIHYVVDPQEVALYPPDAMMFLSLGLPPLVTICVTGYLFDHRHRELAIGATISGRILMVVELWLLIRITGLFRHFGI